MHLAVQAGPGEGHAYGADDVRAEGGVDRLLREVALEERDRHLRRLGRPAGSLLAERRVVAVATQPDDRLLADIVEVALPFGLAIRLDAVHQGLTRRHTQATARSPRLLTCLRGATTSVVLLGAQVLARASAVAAFATAVLGHSGCYLSLSTAS